MIDRLPSLFLRIEGAAVLVAALILHFELGYEWWLLVLLLLAPDLSMLGFLAGRRVGTPRTTSRISRRCRWRSPSAATSATATWR